MNINFNKIIKKIIPFAYILLIAYLLNTILLFNLPSSGIEYEKQSSDNLTYRNYDGFYSTSKIQKVKKVVKRKVIKKQEISLLSKYNLRAIYSTLDNKGWISIDNTKTKKSSLLAYNEEIDDYVLTKLFRNFVLFERNGKEFKLEIRTKENNKNINYEITNKTASLSENITVQADSISIKRKYLNSYVSDIDKVWKDISIVEIRKNGIIDGFKVNRVNKKSVFSKLGLKKADIIKSINNNTLKSYADAFSIYNNINKLEYLSIEILRNNEIMELNYEID